MEADNMNEKTFKIAFIENPWSENKKYKEMTINAADFMTALILWNQQYKIAKFFMGIEEVR